MTGLAAADSGIRFLDHGTYFAPAACGEPVFGDMSEYTPEECAPAAERLRRHNTWVVPTFLRFGLNYYPARAFELGRHYVPHWETTNRPAELRASPYFGRQPPTSFADWVNAYRATSNATALDSGWARMEAAGLPLLAASDALAIEDIYSLISGSTRRLS